MTIFSGTVAARSRRLCAVLVVSGLTALGVGAVGAPVAVRAEQVDVVHDWSATSTGFDPANYRAAPYLGNGRIGSVVPPSGAGYQGYGPGVLTAFPLQQPRYTGTYLAGFYARNLSSTYNLQVIAALPAWSGLSVRVAGRVYQPQVAPGAVSDYRQRLDYRDATVATHVVWSPDAGHRVELSYRTFVSRSQPNLAVQQLTVTPRYSGDLEVTDLIDGAAARRVDPVAASADPRQRLSVVGVRAHNSTNTAFLVSALDAPQATGPIAVASPAAMTAGLRVANTVVAGRSYTYTKYVGIADSDDGPDPRAVAAAAARSGRDRGFAAEYRDHAAAWSRLWRSTVEVPGRDDYQTWVTSALYSVLSSVRAGRPWSVPPAGLSSEDYGGLTFWDAETWIFPDLLALHPDLARTIVDFRAAALPAARANARAYGLPGASYPWADGPAQQCAAPTQCLLVEEHLQNEIALAQWQYYLATGDRRRLRADGAPVITAIADYLAARVGPKLPDGHYHYAPAAGADEYVALSVDNALTNGGVINTMRIASAAALLAGLPVNPRWADVAANMALPPDIAPGVPGEYLGYRGAPIKQADTVLLSYPFDYHAPDYSAAATLRYYFDRTDPDGPNMSNSVGAILSARYDPCRTQHYLDQSAQPYLRGPFHFQSESRGDRAGANAIGQPAWIFVTGAASFVQGMLYAPTGLRWTDDGPRLDPMLPNGFPDGITVRDMAVRDSTVTIAIRPGTTAVTLDAGPPVTFHTPAGPATVTAATPLLLPTRRAC